MTLADSVNHCVMNYKVCGATGSVIIALFVRLRTTSLSYWYWQLTIDGKSTDSLL